MIRVALDHQIFERQVFGGISKYFVRMAEVVFGRPDARIAVVAPLSVNSYLRASEMSLLRGVALPSFRGAPRCAAAVNKMLAGPAIAAFRPDIIHETFFSTHAVGRPKRARVLTVYDMIHEKFPQMFPASDTTPADKAAAIRRADHIFCISESTRRDLIELFPEAESKASVTLLGFDHELLNGGEPKVVDRPYLLYVGVRGGYKNFKALLEAYAGSTVLRADWSLVAAGGGGFNEDERGLISRLGVADKVMQINASDELLKSLYGHASAFVYPSLYEGFGIPPLEAMAAACPVVCVRASSVPEVCGDAAEYAETGSSEELRNAIERVVTSIERSDALVRTGRQRLSLFSWERCAAETFATYGTLV